MAMAAAIRSMRAPEVAIPGAQYPGIPRAPLYHVHMDGWEPELAATAAKVAESKALLASRIEYRDRQIRQAIGQGATWAQVQRVTGLSPRGLALALNRTKQ